MGHLRLIAKPEHVKKLRSAGYRVVPGDLQSPGTSVYIDGLVSSKAINKHQEKISAILEISSDSIDLL